MNIAIIDNATMKVINIGTGDTLPAEEGKTFVFSDTAAIGDTYDGANFGRSVVTPATPTIEQQIANLEAQQTLRRVRDAIAGTDNGWLKNLETQIAALRAQL